MLRQSEKQRLSKLLKFERAVTKQGYEIIAGCDEAGRGPLAGPVVAAAVILPKGLFLKGLDDSKKLSPKKRHELYTQITVHAKYSVGIIDHTTIDEINILQATIRAMVIAIEGLSPGYALIDGRLNLPLKVPYECIIKGDQRSQSIAAASIIAKETRDRIMEHYHSTYPDYGFDQHKGYGTAKHLAAIKEHGRCPIHRRSFRVLD